MKNAKSMINYCVRCPHGKTRETCAVLCSEADEYAGQDYVSPHEKAVGLIGFGRGIELSVPKTRRGKYLLIRDLLLDGKSFEDISIHVECDEKMVEDVYEEMYRGRRKKAKVY